MAEEAVFKVCVRDFKAVELTTRNRFRDKLKIYCDFDGNKFKSKSELIGGGDVMWKLEWKTEYKIFSHKFLDEKLFLIKLMKNKVDLYGALSIDLYTLATGPIEHNLPIYDGDKALVGRLSFNVEMEQVTNVAVIFKEIRLRNLKTVQGECNPYLKYGYSRYWPAIMEKKMIACKSVTKMNTSNPVWNDLPEVRFRSTLSGLLHESVVIHVTHRGKTQKTTIGRCNLLFRTLVDNGKTFKDDDLISFRGPLKVDNAEIEGLLVFRYLPAFAQMKPVNVVRRSIHTEKGVFDSMTLLPGLPVPKLPIILTDKEKAVDTSELLNHPTSSPAVAKRVIGDSSSPPTSVSASALMTPAAAGGLPPKGRLAALQGADSRARSRSYVPAPVSSFSPPHAPPSSSSASSFSSSEYPTNNSPKSLTSSTSSSSDSSGPVSAPVPAPAPAPAPVPAPNFKPKPKMVGDLINFEGAADSRVRSSSLSVAPARMTRGLPVPKTSFETDPFNMAPPPPAQTSAPLFSANAASWLTQGASVSLRKDSFGPSALPKPVDPFGEEAFDEPKKTDSTNPFA